MRQEKRHKLQLFYEILCAIDDSIINHKIAKHTHIQHDSRLSYDKMMNHINLLEQKGMIHTHSENNNRSITITSKGKIFVKPI
jgi:predicted transcriptional regulator